MGEEKNEQQTVPVIEEELVTGTRPVKTGSVRIHKEVNRSRKIVDAPAIRDVVSVNRVPVNRVLTEEPQIREEGDLLIVPVVEEEIIVQKRLVLKEEIHIQRRRVHERVTKEIALDSENAVIERLDADGRLIAKSRPREHTPSARSAGNSILK